MVLSLESSNTITFVFLLIKGTELTFLNKNGGQNFYDSLVALYNIPYNRKEVQILFIFPARSVLLLIVY